MKRHARLIAIILTLLITLALAGCRGTEEKTTAGSETTKATTTRAATTTAEEKLPEVSLIYWAYSRWRGINVEDGTGEYADWQRSIAKTFMEMNPNVKSIEVRGCRQLRHRACAPINVKSKADQLACCIISGKYRGSWFLSRDDAENLCRRCI